MVDKRKCKQCGEEFTLTDSEIKFYNDKGLNLPKRCSECRKKNNNINNNEKESIKETNIQRINSKNKSKKFRNIIIVAVVLLLSFIGKVFNINFDALNIGSVLQSQKADGVLEFRNDNLWEEHFLKHGGEFGYTTKEDYLEGANEVVTSASSKHKQEAEDGDDIYYDAENNEIVFVSKDGYIRTYFKPSDGIEYYNRQ
ncbi:zinc-ribbon domain containing protein [uncultured Clostridium sp.]|uniref:zinc-ribbon domain containing protein n=1 Tax=uncultured Clostridium sp. TaxID=59620 RepID=UPI002670D2E2|nr:zinc-ribbon domain containing protein [uncultured Clostridium sp.]